MNMHLTCQCFCFHVSVCTNPVAVVTQDHYVITISGVISKQVIRGHLQTAL